ncbi:TIR domain-containing protein [Corallococcus carmarthensis]|nr:TIR domain-containing protein [Corallococcus carmarthensis]
MESPSTRGNTLRRRQFESLREQVQGLLEQFETVLKRARKLSPKDSMLKGLTDKHEETLLRWGEQRFQVAVLALVKSGKSTLINAWLGDEYLPAANTPETTRIVRVRHALREQGVLLEDESVLARGAAAANAYLRERNKEGREADALPVSDELVLEAPLLALKDSELGAQRFELLDTPGPNEAGTSALRGKVEQVLDTADIIVYVLDYTKLKTAEEQTLLELLKDMRPGLLQRCSERLFFVVNKVDQKNRNGLTPEETAEYVSQLVGKVLPGVALTPERVIPVAAEFALLARMVAEHEPTEKALDDFRKRAFGVFDEEASLDACRRMAPKLLEKSRVTRLEDEVLSFVYQHRGRLLLEGFLETLSRSLAMLDNHLQTTRGALKKGHEELVRRKRELEKDLEQLQEGLQDVEDTTKAFQSQTEEWVRAQFGRFREQAREEIQAALTPGAKRRFPERLARIVGGVWAHLTGTDTSQEAAQHRIRQVDQALQRYFYDEFLAFRMKLEGEAHERQRELAAKLQALISPLARRIEKEVGKALNVSLKPVPVRLPELSLVEFQQDMQAELHRLVKSSTRQVPHTTQQERVIQKEGWCQKKKSVWVDVTTYTVQTSHGISGQELLRLWEQRLTEQTQTSVQTARGLVGQMTRGMTRQIRKELKTYADGYMEILERELAESESGSSEREARLRKVESLVGEVEALTSDMDDCARKLLPAGRGADAPEAHDVFICYGQGDRPAIRKIVDALKGHGIKPFVDFDHIPPGAPWLPVLEQQLKTVRSVAVFIGKNELGPWQEKERQLAIQENIRRKCPVIPVLLEDCGDAPDLPPFLDGSQRVDFRQKDSEPLQQLIRGIRGR